MQKSFFLCFLLSVQLWTTNAIATSPCACTFKEWTSIESMSKNVPLNPKILISDPGIPREGITMIEVVSDGPGVEVPVEVLSSKGLKYQFWVVPKQILKKKTTYKVKSASQAFLEFETGEKEDLEPPIVKSSAINKEAMMGACGKHTSASISAEVPNEDGDAQQRVFYLVSIRNPGGKETKLFIPGNFAYIGTSSWSPDCLDNYPEASYLEDYKGSLAVFDWAGNSTLGVQDTTFSFAYVVPGCLCSSVAEAKEKQPTMLLLSVLVLFSLFLQKRKTFSRKA